MVAVVAIALVLSAGAWVPRATPWVAWDAPAEVEDSLAVASAASEEGVSEVEEPLEDGKKNIYKKTRGHVPRVFSFKNWLA